MYGTDRETRTPDIKIRNFVLFHLSYIRAMNYSPCYVMDVYIFLPLRGLSSASHNIQAMYYNIHTICHELFRSCDSGPGKPHLDWCHP